MEEERQNKRARISRFISIQATDKELQESYHYLFKARTNF